MKFGRAAFLLLDDCFKLLGCVTVAMSMGYNILSVYLPTVLRLTENEIIKAFSSLDLAEKSHSWNDLIAAAVTFM
jgi:hypothetical protein